MKERPREERRGEEQEKMLHISRQKSKAAGLQSLAKVSETCSASTSYFYKVLNKWMRTPMMRAPKHPTVGSARTVLSNFTGSPELCETQGTDMIERHTTLVVVVVLVVGWGGDGGGVGGGQGNPCSRILWQPLGSQCEIERQRMGYQ